MTVAEFWTRRAVLQSLGLAAGAATITGRALARVPGGTGLEERLDKFFGESDQRPQLVWTNC